MALDYNQLLDEILDILSKRDASHVNLATEIEDIYNKRHAIWYDKDVRMTELLDKLVDDGYVKTKRYNNDTESGYNITFDGRAFLSQGGYHGAAERADIDIRLAISKEDTDARIAFWIMVGSIAAATCSLLYLLWSIWAHYHPIFPSLDRKISLPSTLLGNPA